MKRVVGQCRDILHLLPQFACLVGWGLPSASLPPSEAAPSRQLAAGKSFRNRSPECERAARAD